MNVLCIGAGKEQCYAIIKAQELGLHVIAVDKNSDAEGLSIADVGIPQDIKEVDKVIKIAREYNIKAVIPTPIGKYLTVVGAVNDALGLKGINYEAAVNCTDKTMCAQILQKQGIFCAKQILCENEEDIKKAIIKIGIPCILKPRRGSGSRGVISIWDEGEIDKSILKHLQTKGEDESIVEEFIKGKEYGVDGIIENRIFNLVLVREKIMTPLPYRQEIGYFSPADLCQERINNIKSLISQSCKALNINNCPINADVIINNIKESNLVEIAGRPAGYSMSSFFIPYVTGIDIIAEGIYQGIGKAILNKKQSEIKPLLYHFLNLKEGYVVSLPKEEDFPGDNILSYEINIKTGDYMGVVKEGRDILNRGFIAAKGQNLQQAMKSCSNVLDKFVIE